MAYNNLITEGFDEKQIHIVGDIVFDATNRNKQFITDSKILEKFGLTDNKYVLVTIHRAENTANKESLGGIVDFVKEEMDFFALVKTGFCPLILARVRPTVS